MPSHLKYAESPLFKLLYERTPLRKLPEPFRDLVNEGQLEELIYHPGHLSPFLLYDSKTRSVFEVGAKDTRKMHIVSN